jgi:hypothetical protein
MVGAPFYFTCGSEADDPHRVFSQDMHQSLRDLMILKWLLFEYEQASRDTMNSDPLHRRERGCIRGCIGGCIDVD